MCLADGRHGAFAFGAGATALTLPQYREMSEEFKSECVRCARVRSDATCRYFTELLGNVRGRVPRDAVEREFWRVVLEVSMVCVTYIECVCNVAYRVQTRARWRSSMAPICTRRRMAAVRTLLVVWACTGIIRQCGRLSDRRFDVRAIGVESEQHARAARLDACLL
jgi:hypothetical protein